MASRLGSHPGGRRRVRVVAESCLLVVLWCLVPARPASPQGPTRWRYIFRNPAISVALDTSRVRRVRGDTVRVWLRTEYAGPQTAHRPGAPARAALEQQDVDCAGHRLGLRSMLLRDANGAVVERRPFTGTEYWTDAVPDSPGEAVVRAVCKRLRGAIAR